MVPQFLQSQVWGFAESGFGKTGLLDLYARIWEAFEGL